MLPNDFLTTELDPLLLSTPFEVQSNWHVITGAPCCGKTTLINQLAEKGFQTVSEAGRQTVERERASGHPIDLPALTRMLKDVYLRTENSLPVENLIFLDRALPDDLTYCRVVGMDPNEILADCFHHRYACVFVLDRFPIQQDGIRFEDDAAASFLDEWLERDYRALGYRVVRVPALPPEARMAFVLERVAVKN